VQRGYGSKCEGNVCKGAARVFVTPSDGASSREQVFRGSGRGSGFIARVESEGLHYPGRGVNMRNNASEYRGAHRRECTSTAMRDSGKGIRCYACGNCGHVATACTMLDGFGRRRISSGNGPRVQGNSPAGPRQ
jgi:hypothetical protein